MLGSLRRSLFIQWPHWNPPVDHHRAGVLLAWSRCRVNGPLACAWEIGKCLGELMTWWSRVVHHGCFMVIGVKYADPCPSMSIHHPTKVMLLMLPLCLVLVSLSQQAWTHGENPLSINLRERFSQHCVLAQGLPGTRAGLDCTRNYMVFQYHSICCFI